MRVSRETRGNKNQSNTAMCNVLCILVRLCLEGTEDRVMIRREEMTDLIREIKSLRSEIASLRQTGEIRECLWKTVNW